MNRAIIPAILGTLLVGCPQEEERTLPDETGDFSVGSSAPRHLGGTQPVSPQIGGTRWSFVEAACTEGEPSHAADMERQLMIRADDDGLVLLYDHTIGEGCTETIAQRAIPGTGPNDEWSMSEEARVSIGECPTAPEEDRPGDLRMRGQFLEVYVQRSRWCNGLEVKMVYAPATASEPRGPQLLRHYATHFNRRDARALTELFADAGSLVEPFNRTAEDQPMRHDGRAAIYGWYQDAFENTPWLALEVLDIETGQTPGSYVMDWHYMDPRLDAPFGGRNRFTIAAGEIFEASIEITEQAVEVEGLEDSDQPSEAAPDTATVESEPSEPDAAADPEAGDDG